MATLAERLRDLNAEERYVQDWRNAAIAAAKTRGLISPEKDDPLVRTLNNHIVLIERVRALEEALRDAVNEAHGMGLLAHHPQGTGAFAPKAGGQWKLCPDDLCVNARALLDPAFTALEPQK